jgi:hypothetical protein
LRIREQPIAFEEREHRGDDLPVDVIEHHQGAPARRISRPVKTSTNCASRGLKAGLFRREQSASSGRCEGSKSNRGGLAGPGFASSSRAREVERKCERVRFLLDCAHAPQARRPWCTGDRSVATHFPLRAGNDTGSRRDFQQVSDSHTPQPLGKSPRIRREKHSIFGSWTVRWVCIGRQHRCPGRSYAGMDDPNHDCRAGSRRRGNVGTHTAADPEEHDYGQTAEPQTNKGRRQDRHGPAACSPPPGACAQGGFAAPMKRSRQASAHSRRAGFPELLCDLSQPAAAAETNSTAAANAQSRCAPARCVGQEARRR